MSKQTLKQYMALTSLDRNVPTVERTFLVYNGQKYSVKDVLPKVFDEWISQVVDNIKNVDRELWEPFHRWQIINAALDGKFLVLIIESGTFFLRLRERKEEQKSSTEVAETA